ncbi:glycosyltransferase family 4 protein [Halorussus sp. AFM4]|uniref:glycosyltransferase family 4 protein n=1 Tax=Halorussus sp. AFM4 TaxID=3421651 RepID=UPI003EBF4D22
MAEVAVVHHDLMIKGGGESVCMNVLEALQDDHDVTLVTLTHPDINELNNYFKTNVNELTVEIPPIAGRVLDRMKAITNFEFDLLKTALLNRYLKRHEQKYDIVVSTTNELALNGDSVQYIHLPQFDRAALPDTIGSMQKSNPIYDVYDQVCTMLAGFNKELIGSGRDRLLTNSHWTAEIVEEIYDEMPDVVYPPVDTETFAQFGDVPWSEKEDGFVTIGRIMPLKKILRVVDIIAGVHELGHDVSLKIYGPPSDEGYYAKVEERVAEYDFVHLEGELRHSDEAQMRSICRQKYYLNGTDYEAFGISIAEMVAAGAIPFVPNNGGQTEIVNGREELVYESVEDAVDKIDRVLTDETLASKLKTELADEKSEFTYETFQWNVRTAVNETLSR